MSKRNRNSGNTIARNPSPTVKSFGLSNDPATGYLFGNTYAQSGVPVTHTTALTVPAVYNAIKAISEDIAKMDLRVTKPTPNRSGNVPYYDHPLNDLLENPNEWQTRFDFVAFASGSYSLRGNSYTVIVRDLNGYTPVGLIPVNPDRCSPYLHEDGRISYCVTHPLLEHNGAIWVRAEDMLHVKGFSLNGFIGLSPIAVMAESIGLSIAVQQNSAKVFGNGSNISGTIDYPGTLSPEAAQRLAESWRQSYSGLANSSKVAVLEDGAKFSKISMTNDEAQLLESRKFQIEEVCRAFRIPPHKLFSLESAHYDNLETQNLEYINDSLRPFTERFEAECKSKLLMPGERKLGIKVKFDFNSIIKDDTETRFKSYTIGVQNGWLSINDVRRSEGLNDIGPEGDIYRVSLASAPATTTNEPKISPDDPGNPEQPDKE